MPKIYFRLIHDQKAMTIEQVPERWRAATQALLDAAQAAEQPVGTPTAKSTVVSVLDNMTVPRLQEYAANNGIDLGGATKKADIVAAIKAAEANKGDA
ncbi:MAG: Rho termination factor N-terminal domain-containing protein [Pseudoflavonifractor sp.]